MRSVNTRIHLSLRTVIYDAVVAEAEQIGFSLSDVVNKALYDAGYGKPVATKAPATTPKGKELPPVVVWDGDPYKDPNKRYYFSPVERMGWYRAEHHTPKQIREYEDLVLRKWPQAKTVYDEGLIND